MTRPSQIALIVLIYLDGVLYAAWRGASAGATALGGLLAVIATAAAVHLANEAADHETDRQAQRTPFSGGSGALATSGLDPRVPLVVSLVTSLAVATLALLALAGGVVSPAATALLGLGLVGGLAYSLPPVAAMRRGWGEPLNALLGSLALPLFGVAVVAGTVAILDVVAFLPLLCVAFASVMATAWPDRRADAATGKATMQVRLPASRLRQIHAAATAAYAITAVVAIAAGAIPEPWVYLLVAPALIAGLGTYTRRRSPLPNVAAMVGLAVLMFAVLALAVAT